MYLGFRNLHARVGLILDFAKDGSEYQVADVDPHGFFSFSEREKISKLLANAPSMHKALMEIAAITTIPENSTPCPICSEAEDLAAKIQGIVRKVLESTKEGADHATHRRP